MAIYGNLRDYHFENDADDIRGADAVSTANRQQARITRTGADEVDGGTQNGLCLTTRIAHG